MKQTDTTLKVGFATNYVARMTCTMKKSVAAMLAVALLAGGMSGFSTLALNRQY